MRVLFTKLQYLLYNTCQDGWVSRQAPKYQFRVGATHAEHGTRAFWPLLVMSANIIS